MKRIKLFGHRSEESLRSAVGSDSRAAFDPDTQYAVVRSSICTGEKVFGFKDKKGGHFTEIAVIRTPDDLESFKRIYGVKDVRTEY